MSNETIFKKSTKIVATIGPVSDSEEQLEALIRAGMNVARFNTKHNLPEWHQERIRRVKIVAKRMNVAIATLLDLQGPEIRLNLPYGPEFDIEVNETMTFASQTTDHDDKKLAIIPANVIAALSVGDSVMIDDGIGEFHITEKRDDVVIATALSSFKVKDRKTLNTPGVDLADLPSLIDKDYAQLDGATNDVLDYVALSFARNAKDIEILREELKKRNLTAKIIAKIENQASIDNLDSIIAVSDAVMVARGDLAVEVPFQELTHWQKVIIQKSREMNKPVITATQMLKSMVDNPRPTRAEVSDVAHAVYDGTDAVMLSEETTIGKYPVKAVETQALICQFNEQFAKAPKLDPDNNDVEALITETAISLLENVGRDGTTKINKIVCLTETGRTAQLISRFRPHVPIYAITGNEDTYHNLSLSFGVNPVMIDMKQVDIEHNSYLIQSLKSSNVVESKERILIVFGSTWGTPGQTNHLTIVDVE